MTIEQLRCFVTVERLNSFSEAAEYLYSSQSTVSKQIKMLEKELGIKLFLRTTRKVEVTSAGNLLSGHAEKILAEYDAIQQGLRDLEGGDQRPIQIISIPVLAQYGLVDAFSDFLSLYPDIQLQIMERDSDEVLRELTRGAADIGILRGSHPQIGALQNGRIIPIVEDELCLLVNSQHPLASRGEVSLKDLSGETIYLLSSHTGFYDFCVLECAKVGAVPYIKRTELSRYALQSLVSSQVTVALMARKVAETLKTSNIYTVLLKEHPKIDLSFVVRDDYLGDDIELLIHHIIDFVLT